MHPVLFNIGSICIYSYGFMIAVAFSVGTYLSRRAAKEAKIDPDFIVNLAFLLLFSGLIGARLLYVTLNIRDYMQDPLEILMLPHGGLSIYGGIFFAAVTGIIYARKKGYPVYKIGDLLIPYVALGQAIGRIGCFLNGCCYGMPMKPFCGMQNHPAQIYELIFDFLGFLLLWNLRKKIKVEGGLFLLYLMIYAVIRTIVSRFRADNLYLFGISLTLADITSIGIFITAIAIFIKKRD